MLDLARRGFDEQHHVNNRRIDRHELVDNDVIKFGSVLVKFKSL